jgi:ornithine cyclodeaminase/alanine dehydrogenase-like protein (mu-crystallin family)
MLVINQKEVSELLTMKACIKVMENVLSDLARGLAIQQLRTLVPVEETNVLGLMPGYLKREEVVGAKIITIYPDNHKIGSPSHQGIVLMFDSKDGSLKATIDGEKITAIRTAAVSAVATNLLARKDSETLSILGSGEQAKTHLEAMLAVRPIELVKVWSQTEEKAMLFKKEMEQQFKVSIQVYSTLEDAVTDADIICTVTASKVPILEGVWVKEGAHINAVGAHKAKDRELASELVKKSKFYVDRVESAINESGDYLIPLKEGVIDEEHIVGEIGELLIEKIDGRNSESCITVFESLGLAIEDLAASHFIYQEAVRRNKGTSISM